MRRELQVSWILTSHNGSRSSLCKHSSSCWKLGTIGVTCCRSVLERQTKGDVRNKDGVIAHSVFDASNARKIGKTDAEEHTFTRLVTIAHSKAAEVTKFSIGAITC